MIRQFLLFSWLHLSRNKCTSSYFSASVIHSLNKNHKINQSNQVYVDIVLWKQGHQKTTMYKWLSSVVFRGTGFNEFHCILQVSDQSLYGRKQQINIVRFHLICCLSVHIFTKTGWRKVHMLYIEHQCIIVYQLLISFFFIS